MKPHFNYIKINLQQLFLKHIEKGIDNYLNEMKEISKKEDDIQSKN